MNMKSRLMKNAGLKESQGNQFPPAAEIDAKTNGIGNKSNLKQDVAADNVDAAVLATFDPDSVYTGLQYELSNMIKPDKHLAKQIVIRNLMNDPHHYDNPESFMMSNIPDEKELVPPSQKLGSADQPSQQDVREGSIMGDPESPENRARMRGRRWTTTYGKEYVDEGLWDDMAAAFRKGYEAEKKSQKKPEPKFPGHQVHQDSATKDELEKRTKSAKDYLEKGKLFPASDDPIERGSLPLSSFKKMTSGGPRLKSTHVPDPKEVEARRVKKKEADLEKKKKSLGPDDYIWSPEKGVIAHGADKLKTP